MSGEALKQEIRKGAEERAKQVVVDAKASAEKILADAEVEAKRILDSRTRDARRRLEQVERSEAAKARMECTKRILGLQSQFIEQVFSEAESRLGRMPTSDPAEYRSVLSGLISEAAQELAGASLVAVVREEDRTLVEDILRSPEDGPVAGGQLVRVSLSDEHLKSSGGVLLAAEDGRSYFVNTFESRLLRAREQLRARVTDILLGRE